MPGSETCVFCDILAGDSLASFVHRDKACAAFMDVQPVNTGHVLVIPNEHAPHLSKMDGDTGARLFRVGHKIAAALRESGLRCEGVNLFLADGEAAGQEVFHVHLHVFPRFSGDGFGFRFGAEYGNLPERSELDGAAKSIVGAM